MKTRVLAAMVLLGTLFAFVRPLHAWEAESPDDPEAHRAAISALASAPQPRQLNADTRQLQSEIRDVPGISQRLESTGVALLARVDSIEKAMTDLDAEVLEQEIRIALSADLLFDFDQHSLKPEAEAELMNLALLVREKASGSVRVFGHTDAKGSEEYNLALSERRAGSVRQWLLKHGNLDPGLEIETRGMGESQPVAPNQFPDGSDNPEGRSLNRRVEVLIDTIDKP